ncbi:MAG: AAA family ATPase [Desulfobacteraceae bacterium]|nr:AAA family ATPase [Desulfobacteraceae bacterium]
MTEQNNPVDIGKEQTGKYKEPVEQIFTSYRFGGKLRSLPDLMLQMDPDEKYVMSYAEHDTYITIREGMQVFQAVSALLSDKTGLKKKLIEIPTSALSDNKELNELRGFCHDFATYAASVYVSKKLDSVIRSQGVEISEEKADLSDMGISLDSSQPETSVIKRLMAPIYAYLVQHADKGEVFESTLVFTVYVKDIFDKYIDLCLERKDAHPELEKHLRGYVFRIMDEFVVLEGYDDKSVSAVSGVVQEVTFQPIRPEEIVGNRDAKQKIGRYIERLALYDQAEQMNPILELGGLAWTSLYDGLPGTGKSSLFRLAMTLLQEISEQVGMKYAIFTVDQSIKDEYYGKTGKMLLQRLSVTQSPNVLSLGVLDDIDLLTSSRDDAQGSDNDINNILMQYLDGVFTVRRGNVINFAASNKPTGLDDALRNRFNDRLIVDGPTTSEDFADMVMILGGKLVDKELIKIKKGYEPFATQVSGRGAKKGKTGDVAAYMAEEFQKYKKASLLEFGKFMSELKEKNPKITGRSARAVIEAIKERSADFDIPREWLGAREVFLDKPYETKVKMLTELYQPITPDILFQEAQRYFDSEERFAHTEAEGHVTRGYNNLMWDVQAQMQYYQEQAALGEKADIAKLDILKNMVREMIQKKEDSIRKVLR